MQLSRPLAGEDPDPDPWAKSYKDSLPEQRALTTLSNDCISIVNKLTEKAAVPCDCDPKEDLGGYD